MAVSDALGIRVIIEPLPPDVSGYWIRSSRGRCAIALNSLDHPNRRRFTWAHEIAHCLFEDGAAHIAADSADSRCACNVFAVELLMPADLVRSRVASLQGINARDFLTRLQMTFGVSREALLRRLEDLSLWQLCYAN